MGVVVIARIQDCSVSFNLYFKDNKRFKLNVSELDQPSLKHNLSITRTLKLGSKKLESLDEKLDLNRFASEVNMMQI